MSEEQLKAELEALKQRNAEEVDEFNAGYDAAQRGEPIESEPSNTPYDQWRVGWAWGKYQQKTA